MRRLGLGLLVLALLGGVATGVFFLTQSTDSGDVAPTGNTRPVLGQKGDEEAAAAGLGFPGFATKNTTRVGGADGIANAAAIAQAVYPSRTAESRPEVVALVDSGDWRTAISAAQLMAPPIRAPLLYADGGELPEATTAALARLRPTGSEPTGDAQVIRVGDVPKPERLETTDVKAGDYAAQAARIDVLASAAARRPSSAVLIAPADDPEYAMPAAGWAAKSGHPVLWATRDELPAATERAIIDHRRPRIYVLGPESAIGDDVVEELEDLAPVVRRIDGPDAVRNAIAFARFSDGRFGWNVVDPGHGVVFASQSRPLDAAAAAPLSASGKYGPLVLVPSATVLPAPLQDYLLDIQPGYDADPVRAVFNHGWVIGDESAVSVEVQSRLDTLLEMQPVQTEEPE